MTWFHSLMHRIGLWVCSMGWHQEPYRKEPKPRGMTPEEYLFHERYHCTRCGLVGRLDGRGNLDPAIATRPGSVEEVWT